MIFVGISNDTAWEGSVCLSGIYLCFLSTEFEEWKWRKENFTDFFVQKSTITFF